jgi:hypothetical protein
MAHQDRLTDRLVELTLHRLRQLHGLVPQSPLALGVLGVMLLVPFGWRMTGPEPRASLDPTPIPDPTDPVPTEPPVPEVTDVVSHPIMPEERDDPEELLRACEGIAAKLGSVSLEDCTKSRLQLSGGRSNQGKPILVAEYPPLPAREPLGRVLLFGGIHGDELASVSIVYSWLKTLDRNHSGLFHWRVAPLLNPDGLLREKPQRMNGRGVDLNRNFPSPNWQTEAEDYWVRRTSRNPRRYPGKTPLSEPESRWLHQQIENFRPAAIVAVHAPSHVVDYDGPPEPPERLGPLLLNRMGTYPGSLGRFAGVHLGLKVLTIELPSAGIMPSQGDQKRMWVDLVAWLRQNVPNAPPPRSAHIESPPVPAAATGMGS